MLLSGARGLLRSIENSARAGKIRWLHERLASPYARFLKTPVNLARNRRGTARRLEIGPGVQRIPGFETINVVWTPHTDYVANASKKMPFASETFELIYASHILEHTPWYQLEATLREWVRVLKTGGALEIWVPNGLLIAQAFVDAENGGKNEIGNDGWYRFNPDQDPCVWANGRIFSYGDGTGSKSSPNWHLSLFSPRFLEKVMVNAGLHQIERMDASQVRGYDHGWINLGMKGRKR